MRNINYLFSNCLKYFSCLQNAGSSVPYFVVNRCCHQKELHNTFAHLTFCNSKHCLNRDLQLYYPSQATYVITFPEKKHALLAHKCLNVSSLPLFRSITSNRLFIILSKPALTSVSLTPLPARSIHPFQVHLQNGPPNC